LIGKENKVIYYVGDIHGNVNDVAAIDRAAIKAGVEIVVQVGDFGMHWPGQTCPINKYFEKRKRQGRPGPIWYTCAGNHDNWDKLTDLAAKQDSPSLIELSPDCYYVPRGTIVELDGKAHLFFGGAESTDREYRTEGKSWWADETPSAAEFQKFFDGMEQHPEVVVTHDAPLCVEIYRHGRDGQPTPRNLQNVLTHAGHAPVHWYFGHHHILKSWEVKGTEFHCCGFDGEWVEG
jgi:hypothetical protein